MNPRITDNRAEYNEKRFQYFGGYYTDFDLKFYELRKRLKEFYKKEFQ